MIAVILAAGMGKRLKNLTKHQTKCMIKVCGERLIDRVLNSLIEIGVEQIVIITGFKAKNLKNHVEKKFAGHCINFIHNPLYETTNNIYSLSLAKHYLEENDTLLLESDLIFDTQILRRLKDDSYPNLSVVSKYETWMDGTLIELNSDKSIMNMYHKNKMSKINIFDSYKTVNIHKFSKEFLKNQYLPFLEAYINAFGTNHYYEQVLNVLSLINRTELKCMLLKDEKWYEIDDAQDLTVAETLFGGITSLSKYQQLYGGYWRFPKLMDFCYLVNPFFSTQDFMKQYGLLTNTLAVSYPSGQKTNIFLASNFLNIKKEYLCVGNGASELIRILPTIIPEGRIGLVNPTFDEYPNSFSKFEIIPFKNETIDFSINIHTIIEYYSNKNISTFILVNPDIPTGNCISFDEVKLLLNWTRDSGIFLIIDESFMDFSDNSQEDTLLKDTILEEYLNLIIIKSISKSYGVPGVRLGIFASSNNNLIGKLRNQLPIWNINSYGEYFMELIRRYEEEYKIACTDFKNERKRMFNLLQSIIILKVYPSQGNFFLCKINSFYTSTELTTLLLKNFNILIKDCKTKIGLEKGEFIRIAIKQPYENDKLVKALTNLTLHVTSLTQK